MRGDVVRPATHCPSCPLPTLGTACSPRRPGCTLPVLQPPGSTTSRDVTCATWAQGTLPLPFSEALRLPGCSYPMDRSQGVPCSPLLLLMDKVQVSRTPGLPTEWEEPLAATMATEATSPGERELFVSGTQLGACKALLSHAGPFLPCWGFCCPCLGLEVCLCHMVFR